MNNSNLAPLVDGAAYYKIVQQRHLTGAAGFTSDKPKKKHGLVYLEMNKTIVAYLIFMNVFTKQNILNGCINV